MVFTRLRNGAAQVKDDAVAAANNLYDLHANDNTQDIDWEKRHTLEALGGLAAAGAGGALVDEPVRNAGESAYDAMADAIPDSPIDIDVSIDSGGGNGGGSGTATDSQTATEETTNTATEDQTTDLPDLPYDGILDGLGQQSGDTGVAFQDYTLTALNSNLEDVGLEEAVNNSEDYEASIMDALEGTYADGDDFSVGGYGEIGIQEDLNANGTFKQYLNEADDRGVLEDEIHDYLGDIEVSWN